MAQNYKPGDLVEVWSNSQNRWIPSAVVIEAPTVDCKIDGYDVRAGALKVEYEGNSKWLLPEMVPTQIRRSPAGTPPGEAPAATHCPPVRSMARAKCKFCDRQVQPGLTRNMKTFDTCCKKCALSGGSGDHDANCGGSLPSALPSSATRPISGIDPYVWLKGLIDSEEALQNYAEELFETATGHQKAMTFDHFKKAIKELLLKPVGATLSSAEETLQEVFAKYDTSRHGIDVSQFKRIARTVLVDYFQSYFPLKLPCNTHDFVRRNKNKLQDVYEMGEKLGEGSFGKVYIVTHKISREKRVCKTIEKFRGRAGMPVDEILREIESMAVLDHPNVIKIYEYFEDDNEITQIMEPCNGGELQNKIDDRFRKKASTYDERFICDVMKQTLRALAFMHSCRFMHKDLKPQNIMMVDKVSPSVKLIDFGLAELFESDKAVSEVFGGTLLYIAPEGFGRGLEMKSDVWSAGVILYNLITGDYPFMETWPLPPGKDMDWWQNGVRRAIEKQNYRRHQNLTNGTVSADCLDLMGLMLTKDPAKRPDATKCLEHCWFATFAKQPPPLSVGVTQCLDAYAGQPELKKAVFLLIAHQCTVPALQELRAIFTHFDTRNLGTLSVSSINEVLQMSGMSMLRAARVIHALDRDNSGAVSWTEFIAAALCVSVSHNKPLVAAAFSIVDQDNDGKITAQDFEDLFAKGSAVAIWHEQLTTECSRIIPGGSTTAKTFTKDQFMDFMKEHMKVIAGDLVSAVR